jgi:hypothetical protein
VAGALLRQHDAFGAAVCVWWAGQNLLDLAPDIADARAPARAAGRTDRRGSRGARLGVLGELGWLRFDRLLGLGAHRLGLVFMAGALVWAGIWLAKHRVRPEPDNSLPAFRNLEG